MLNEPEPTNVLVDVNAELVNKVCCRLADWVTATSTSPTSALVVAVAVSKVSFVEDVALVLKLSELAKAPSALYKSVTLDLKLPMADTEVLTALILASSFVSGACSTCISELTRLCTFNTLVPVETVEVAMFQTRNQYSGALIDQHALHIFNCPGDPDGFLGRQLSDDLAAMRIDHAQNAMPRAGVHTERHTPPDGLDELFDAMRRLVDCLPRRTRSFLHLGLTTLGDRLQFYMRRSCHFRPIWQCASALQQRRLSGRIQVDSSHFRTPSFRQMPGHKALARSGIELLHASHIILLQERQDRVRHLVCLRQHRRGCLLMNLILRQLSRFCSVVSVHNPAA